MKHRKTFRAAFVVTITATAGLVGCGAAVTPGMPPTDDVPVTTDGPVTGDVPATACPATAPVDGSACGSPGAACNYDPCGPYFRTYARCEGGRWSVSQATCNPPPPPVDAGPDVRDVALPDTNPPAPCPMVTPSAGSACVPSGQSCSYANPRCDGAYNLLARCPSGVWEVLEGTCNPPPPPPCPSVAPASGASCPLAGQQCRYGDCARLGTPETFAECRDGRWVSGTASCNPPPPPPPCPTTRPADGAACGPVTTRCSYEPCGPGSMYYRYVTSCEAGAWRSMELICNPPPPVDAGAPDV